ncbi:Y4yA family PLP-dependent enzyme [Kitasatospora kifunensis]|uniref:Diaminopimelate decarboxylase n=1 Tax=Kitasatospora kifunensis TaxID=58351 RepID=A0A7W7R870_KITKI|nr:Y4yA family PLP-dependent enzyme [Kitasatospora kifunensis]MBB4927171.1 diaminopimelate decarboxylase [Kitasatospora kifunensis]
MQPPPPHRAPPGQEPLYLSPRLAPPLASALKAAELLHSLTDALGSPLNLVLPEQLAENVERFRAVYRSHHLAGEIFFAHKANRSSALARQLAALDAGMDVASVAELQHALGAGFAPQRIMATGPKTSEFLWLAARVGVTVNLDSRAELEELAALVRKHALPRVAVLLRLSGFRGPGAPVLSRPSRFGTDLAELDGLLEAVERHQDVVELTGAAYHLDTMGLPEKAIALEACVNVLDECRRRGLRPRAVDVGGGYGVNYLADQAQWDRYGTELTNAVLGRRPPLTWQGHGYGLRAEAGTLRGTLGLYPGHRPVAAAGYLEELLTLQAPSLGRPLATLLLENLYDLQIEPGRALVDQCGAVLARVVEVRHTADGVPLVRLAANAGDIGLEQHGVLVDPLLIDRQGRGWADEAGPVGVHLAGNLCLESDLITRRQVFLPRLPQPGDLLAFANTAGYCMDFTAHHAMRQPLARTVALYREDGSWRWRLDDQYWPIFGTRENS